MHHTQQELCRLWTDLKAEKYAQLGQYMPGIVVDDEVEQVLSVPISEGTARVVYTRKPPNFPWSLVK